MFFLGEGGGCIFWSPRGRTFIRPPPLFYTLRLLNALNSEDRGLKVRFSLATIAFDRETAQMSQMLSSQGKNAPSNPYPHYLVRLAASRFIHPPTPRRVFSGVGGVGAYKFWPRSKNFLSRLGSRQKSSVRSSGVGVGGQNLTLKSGPWYGGVQNVWGEENVPENALSRKFLDPSKRASGLLCRGFLFRKNRALTPEGGGKRTVQGGSKTLFGRGVIREVFHPPLFFHPPMASSDKLVILPSRFDSLSPETIRRGRPSTRRVSNLFCAGYPWNFVGMFLTTGGRSKSLCVPTKSFCFLFGPQRREGGRYWGTSGRSASLIIEQSNLIHHSHCWKSDCPACARHSLGQAQLSLLQSIDDRLAEKAVRARSWRP